MNEGSPPARTFVFGRLASAFKQRGSFRSLPALSMPAAAVVLCDVPRCPGYPASFLRPTCSCGHKVHRNCWSGHVCCAFRAANYSQADSQGIALRDLHQATPAQAISAASEDNELTSRIEAAGRSSRWGDGPPRAETLQRGARGRGRPRSRSPANDAAAQRRRIDGGVDGGEIEDDDEDVGLRAHAATKCTAIVGAATCAVQL